MKLQDPSIKQITGQILESFHLHAVPVDPFAIARMEGIFLLPGNYDNCFDARIEYRRKNKRSAFYLFYVPPSYPWLSENRVRFSIAHELGHFYLPKHRELLISGVCHGSQTDFISDKEMEREADIFASELLMPHKIFVKYVHDRPDGICTLRDLEKIAGDTFKTSLTSTAIRYVDLNFEPCAMALSFRGKVLFSVLSEEMKERGLTRVVANIPNRSEAQKIMQALGKRDSEGRVGSDIWFPNQYPQQLWEESRLISQRGHILTLLAVHK